MNSPQGLDPALPARAACCCWSLLLAVVLPLSLDIFRLNLVGKYLTYAFVAVGLVMVWGYGGVLSLGQGVFFGTRRLCMAMFLKLEASDPISTKIQSTPGIPDFMDWNQITELPTLWLPFKSLPLSLALVVLAADGVGLARGLRDVQAPRGRRVLRDHHAGGGAHLYRAHHRPAGLHGRRQRHHRFEDDARLGHPHRSAPSTSSTTCAWPCWC